ncbi:MAG TPA: RnfH family protein [Burkholderiaceae bacterium]|jgi:putative ubiquitin-RnfH superfamily antitoxin RatB of RatAB toxin-antitoxin module|nr:RnfH family protein [Burkholderiaceae bacterium]
MLESQNTIKAQVCYATQERQIVLDVNLPTGSTLHQAIKASGVLQLIAEIDLSVWRVGIFGKLKSLDAEVRDHDRVEIYRPLIADPMESRRRRASKRNSKGA